jgi:aldose 1-epimerase
MSETEQRERGLAAPSGRQVSIASGQLQAVIVEVGGGIRSFQAAGQAVLDGYGPDERCTSSRGQLLIPWPNRLQRGRYEWDGQQLQVPINEVSKNNALHGYTRWHNWTIASQAPDVAVASLRLHPQEGYPFTLDLSATYSLGPTGLTVVNTARNVGAAACPYAYGAHPYITVGTERVDRATLILPAAIYLTTDQMQIPIGREPVEGTPYDFRHGRPLGPVQLDHAFTDLTRDSDGMARVVLTSPETRRTVTVWLDESYPYVMIFSGDTLGTASRRRQSLAVEPMTCPPNAFATGEDVVRLEPGEAVTTCWGILVEDW